jgi:UDP-N-acetylglucosamine--N-acetylmuramyl-(pentapeptide) pyrophosphoryl-undecaprenol N-acetylglucosamine transferase
MKILLTGGGSGGHLMPLLSVAEEIKKKDASAEILFVGPKSDFNDHFEKAGIEVREIKAGKLRRYFSWQNFLDVFRIAIGTDEAIFHIWKFKPDVIFSKGSFASVPAVVAGHFLKVPIMTHESDAVPGLANKIIGFLSDKTFISFPGSEKHFQISKTVFSGNPVREDIMHGDKPRAMKRFGLENGLPVILIFGGSQGAQKINETLFGALEEMLKNFQVMHICGANNFENIQGDFSELKIENKERYRVFPFLREEMGDAYATADFVVSRAGANSLAEILALEKPGLVIPLSTAAANHQYFNAKYFAEQGMLLLAEEKDLSGEKFLERIVELQEKGEELKEKLAEYNKALGNRKPAEIIAEEILGFED